MARENLFLTKQRHLSSPEIRVLGRLSALGAPRSASGAAKSLKRNKRRHNERRPCLAARFENGSDQERRMQSVEMGRRMLGACEIHARRLGTMPDKRRSQSAAH